ncbi:MAG: DNA-processing protein DprA, partial [Actinocrinis sp.]
ALNHAVEPADPHLGRLIAMHSPQVVLAAIRTGELAGLDPDPARRDHLADRCTGLRLRLEPGHVESGIAAAEAVGAVFLTPQDSEWPVRLDDLGEQCPIGIWIKGSHALALGDSLDDALDDPPGAGAGQSPWSGPIGGVGSGLGVLSVVGARACTGYGAHVAGAIASDLTSAGAAIVSGAALGIDAAAHRGSIAVGGPTLAVLACGIDRVYPRSHETLLHAVAEHGAVISELPPGASPTRFRFLHRNRIIAALGSGTLVVEAGWRSGSLVTARLAAELGRVVMAVPGPVTSDQSAGTHALIRDGATLVTDAGQIREACNPLTLAAAPPVRAAARPARTRATSVKPSTSAGSRDLTGRRPPPAAEPGDPIEELVAEALLSLGESEGADVLAIARVTGIGPDAVFAALGRLAAIGRAVRSGGGWTLP